MPDFRAAGILAEPFSVQMFAVYLLRHFSIEQVEHIARARSPENAVAMNTTLRRYLGIGNSTGLGMAPLLINHPQLIQRWILSRESALARVLDQVPTEADRWRLIELTRRAMQHLSQTVTEDRAQQERNRETVASLPEVLNWLETVPLDTDLWQQLTAWAERTLQLETQELVNTLLMELYPAVVEPFEDQMSADEKVELVPRMPLVRLKQLIDTHYDWALGTTSAPGRPATGSGTDPSKRRASPGVRHEEPGAEKEMLLAIAPRVQRAHDAICDYLADYPRALVVEFLMQQPRHKRDRAPHPGHGGNALR